MSGTVNAAPSIRNVAIVGIGSMGNPIARRILAAGFNLTVCDANVASVREFSDLGARITVNLSDCAECDAVIVLVATPEQMRAVTVGEGGLLTSGIAIKPRYLVIMSTVAPNDMLELEKCIAGTSTRVVDAPISGGVVSAQKGTLTIMAGGAENDVCALRSLFEVVGTNVFHCGSVGAGQATKIINNIIAISNLMISAEAYRIAIANGLHFDQFIPVFEASSARNYLSKHPGDASEAYAAWSRSVDGYLSMQKINRKDIDLALSLATPDMSLPAINALRELLDKAGDETLANWRAIGDKASG